MQLIWRHAATLLVILIVSWGVPFKSSADAGSDGAGIPVKYWGNLFSLKFHRPSCPFAKAMSPHNRVFFNFRKQAIDSGQVPCRYCLPPTWNTVHAQVLNPGALKSTSSESSGQSSLMPEEPLPVPENGSLQREITVTH